MKKEIAEKFGDVLRIRVCGILTNDMGVLMVKHDGLSSAGYFWAPPGGGMSFGQSAESCLKREFQEETGLEIAVDNLLFVNEFYENPFHAVELFFRVRKLGGSLKIGHDPELNQAQQIINDVRFFTQKDIQDERGPQLHTIFHQISVPSQLLNLKGYFQNWK